LTETTITSAVPAVAAPSVRPVAGTRIAEVHLYRHDLPVRDGPYRIASGDV
jgi:hypothetical protein